jgi:hypothetical protein
MPKWLNEVFRVPTLMFDYTFYNDGKFYGSSNDYETTPPYGGRWRTTDGKVEFAEEVGKDSYAGWMFFEKEVQEGYQQYLARLICE